MKKWLKFLAQPLSYLFIQYGNKSSSKKIIDLLIPLIGTAALLILIFTFGPKLPLFSEEGLKSVQTLLTLTFPFYIGALTAVAAANSDHLDDAFNKPRDKNSPKRFEKNFSKLVWKNESQREEREIISRRAFLISLFGHLAFVSFSLLILILIPQLLGLSLTVYFEANIANYMYGAFNTFFLLFLCHLICVTFYALVFLNISIHRASDPDQN